MSKHLFKRNTRVFRCLSQFHELLLLELLNLHLLLLESLSVGESTLEGLRLLLMHLLMIGIVYLRHRIHLHILILLHLVTEELNRALERVG